MFTLLLIGFVVFFITTIILTYILYRVVKNSADLIQIEIDQQQETKKRIAELFLYLRELKDTTIAVEDVLISEIYRNCMQLYDYFENVYFKDEELTINK